MAIFRTAHRDIFGENHFTAESAENAERGGGIDVPLSLIP
jgi:hypothetical protein